MRTTVGIPAFATTTRGEYPPFAVMSTIWMPLTIVAVGAGRPSLFISGPAGTIQKAIPITVALIARAVSICIFILQKLKSGLIIPVVASIFERFNAARAMTIRQAA